MRFVLPALSAFFLTGAVLFCDEQRVLPAPLGTRVADFSLP